MLALPDPASNVASEVVLTSKKSGVSVDDRAAKHYHRRVGVCFHCFHVLPYIFNVSHFSYRSTSWSSPCFDVFFRKESSCSWMALDW